MTLSHSLANKKKLRRIARQTSGTTGRALLTLAMAGMLASPLVGSAHAVVTEWDGGNLANTEPTEYITSDKIQNITGTVTVTGAVHGANSPEDFSAKNYTGKITMEAGASLTISSIMGAVGTVSTGQIQVKDIQISGGTLTIGGVTGGTPAKWSDGPMLVGGLGGGKTYIDNTTVVLNDYAQLVQGAHNPASNSTDFTTLGTTFTFNGTSAASAPILRMEGTGETAAIFHIAKDSNVYVPTNNFGRIVGEDLSISGALLSLVDGSAMLMSKGIASNGDLKGSFAGSSTPELEIYNTGFSVYKFNDNNKPNTPLGVLHVEGAVKVGMEDANNRGSLSIGQGGTALIEKSGTVTLAGGSLHIWQGGQMLITSADIAPSAKADIIAAITTGNTHALKIAGGTLTSSDNGSVYVNGSTLITGGTGAGAMSLTRTNATLVDDMQIIGLANAAATLTIGRNTRVTAKKNVTLAGDSTGLGTLSVQGSGEAQLGQSIFEVDGDLNINAHGKVDALSNGFVMVDGDLNINAYGKVDAKSNGFVMVEGDTSLAAHGTVETAANSFFVVQGNMTAAANATINNAGSFSVVGTFLNTGATINNTGDMYISDMYTSPSTNGAYTHSSGYTSVGALHLTNMNNGAPVVNVSAGKLHFTGMGATTGLGKKILTHDATTNGSTPVINVSGLGHLFLGWEVGGTFDGAINISSGNFSIGKGEWTVASVNATGGQILTGYRLDGTTPSYGTLNVGDLSVTGTATMALRTGKVNVTGNFASKGGTVTLYGGIMTVDASQVYDASQSNLLKTTVSQFVPQGGVLNIKNGATLSFDNAKKFHDALVGTNGLWSGVTVSGITPESKSLADGSSANIIDKDKAAVADVNTLSQFAVGTAMTNGTSATLGAAAGQIALTGTAVSGNVALTTLDVTTIVGNGKAGDSLVLGAGSHKTTITVADAGTLNLGAAGASGGGTLNGDIINVNAKPATINVASGDFTIKGDVTLTAGTGTATGTLNLNEGGKLAVQGNVAATTLELAKGALSATGDVSTNNLTLAGGGLEAKGDGKTVTVSGDMKLSDKSHFNATELSLTGAKAHSIDSGSTVEVKTLTVSGGSTLSIGSSAGGQGVLVAETANLNGATVFLDPAWKDGQTISDASKMAVGGSAVTGKYVIGENSWVTMGSTDLAWLPTQVAKAGLVWGKNHVTAALGIFTPQNLQANNGGIKVDGSLTSAMSPAPSVAANHAIFAAQSLLVVNALGIGSNAALTAAGGTAGLLTVDATSKLLLVDGKAGETYTITKGFADSGSAITDGGWTDGNLVSSSRLQSLTLDKATAGTVTVAVDAKSASSVLPGLSGSMSSFLDAFEAEGMRDVDSANAGIAFISNVTSGFNGLSDREVVSVLESATQTALTGGAPSASLDAVSAVAGPVTQRTGIATPMLGGSASYSSGDSAYSFGVWGMPMFRSSEISSQKAGSFKYSVDNKLYGGIIGFDVTNPLMAGDLRMGAALNIGTGDSKSRGGLSKTKNEYDFWGASVYAGYRQENLGLSADFGFNSTASDIKQDLPGTLNMGGHLTSKVDAKSYTVGLKAEYMFRTNAVDITPSIGMRYIGYRQDGYNVNSQRGTVFHMASASMDTFTFPIGVKFSRELELSSGWNMTPELNLAIVPAAGDTKLTSKARIPGVNISPASMTGHVFDGLTGEVGFGLRLVKDNISFGVSYDFQGGSHQRAHSVSGSLRYTF